MYQKIAIIVLIGAVGSGAALAGPAADLVAKIPAKSPAEGAAALAGLVKLGPAGIVDVCKMLVPPGTGNDTNARYALSGLMLHVNRPGADTERMMVAGALVKALAGASDNEVKAFLMRGIQLVGRADAVTALGAYLGDDRLCAPAIRAIENIGTPNAADVLIKALPGAKGTRRVAIVRALGTVRAEKAATLLHADMGSEDLALREAAIWAVSNIAEPQPATMRGFVAAFNGKDLTGWKGLVGTPKSRAAMAPEKLAAEQKSANQRIKTHWNIVDGVLVFDGRGKSLCTAKDYGDFDMYVDWKIKAGGDSGIYLRGTPQVQIWDVAKRKEGSGGLFNNKKNPSKPSTPADRPVEQWNRFRIRMIGPRVSVWLNGQLVVDKVVLENYWERGKPIYPTGQIELQNHGNTLWFRNVFIREIPRKK